MLIFILNHLQVIYIFIKINTMIVNFYYKIPEQDTYIKTSRNLNIIPKVNDSVKIKDYEYSVVKVLFDVDTNEIDITLYKY